LEIHDTRSAGDVETKTETATATEIDSRKWPVDDRVATTTSPLPLQLPQFSVFSAQFAAFSLQRSAFSFRLSALNVKDQRLSLPANAAHTLLMASLFR